MTDSMSVEPQPQPARSPRLRLLSRALAGVVVIAVCILTARGWTASQEAKLQRMTVPELETVVKSQPNNGNARYKLGLAYIRDNRLSDATKTLLSVLEQEKEPTSQTADVLNDLGVLYLLQERYYESLVTLQQALALRPNFAAAYANLGRLHLATKMPFTATKELLKATELDAKNLSILCDLGEAHQQTLNHDAAEKVYRQALQLDPRCVPARLGLGKVYYSEGKNAEAIEALNEALKLSPDSAPAQLTLARIGIETAQSPAELQAAADHVHKALESDPQNPDAWYDLGRVTLRQNHPAEAVEALKKALAYSPQHNGALHQIERALRAVGRTAEADRTAKVLQERSLREREELRLEEHIEHNPQDWDAQAQLAEIYLLTSKRGLAALLCEKLKQNAPHHPRLAGLLQELNRQNASMAMPPKVP